MTSIVLIRHGATAWSGSRYLGRTDLPLTAAGRESASIMAEQVAATTPVDVRIVSSPSLRARETAATVAEAIGRRTDVAVAGRPTIVVSHAGSIRVAMALATGRPEAGIAFLAPAEAVHLEVDD